MPSSTRDRLIDVARQLFIRKGIDNTTMNDIATASDRGRRTVYTYFRNKSDIYNAVIEAESDNIVALLREVAGRTDLLAPERLRLFLFTRFSKVVASVRVTDTLKSFFSRDYKRTERLRQLVYDKELGLLQDILRQGVDEGYFDPVQVRRMTQYMPALIQGADIAVSHGGGEPKFLQSYVDFTVDGLKKNT